MNETLPSTDTPLASRKAKGSAFAVFGNPVAQSLGPLMHRAAYARLGSNATYEAYRVDTAAEIVATIRALALSGASVTIPFKETVMPLLDGLDPAAEAIGAVNTIVRREGRLVGYNTDGIGLIRDLEEWTQVPGKTFVVLGAGGAARAAVYALRQAGAIPIVVNRTEARAKELAERFGCPWAPLDAIGSLAADGLINTTPIGMFPNPERSPLSAEEVARFGHVLDMIYNPLETRLLKDAAAAGSAVRPGLGMFVHQGAEQIRLWLGIEPPRDVMGQAVRERLTGHAGD
ncbi:MAG: shikimate dehydrogenase [Deltaproteobacteria bacterium]|nr:shikimate dehydrogenase [Deltaproteobacteria bacterium]